MKNSRSIFSSDYFWLIMVPVIIFIAGYFVGEKIGQDKELEIQREVLRAVKTFASSIDSSKYETITSTPQDNNNPDYVTVRKQLIKLGEINKDSGIKWIYTLVPKDGQIVFSVDSIVGPDHSEPGDVYTEVSPSFVNAVDRAWGMGEASFADTVPYTDRWGTFISVLAPIRNEDNDKTIGVMVVDLDYLSDYKGKVDGAKQLPFVITLLLVLISTLLRLYGINSKRRDNKLLERITEEKKNAEDTLLQKTKELKDEQSRLLASIDSLSFGYMMVDVDGKIILSNPSLLKILEIEKSPKSIEEVSKYFEKVNLLLNCKECIDSNRIVEMKDVQYKNKFLRIFCAPVSDDDEVIGHILIVEDVTEARVMERSRDEFFSIASHELRTPLTAIRGNSQMLQDNYKDKMVDKDMSEMLNDIHESSVRLIDIVNDFLEVSRLEQGRIEIKKENFDLPELIVKVINDMEEMTKAKGISIIFEKSPEKFPAVYSDKVRVDQILFNLLGNSIKFTTKGNITIKIEQIEGFLKISVTDTGIGISEQNQAFLFRKFQQAGENVIARDVTRGTGLGLYICRLIAGRLGSTIGLERSVLGEGSTFAFTLPIAP